MVVCLCEKCIQLWLLFIADAVKRIVVICSEKKVKSCSEVTVAIILHVPRDVQYYC